MLWCTLAMMATTAPNPDIAKDWRNGAVVYQVFVDRFAPSADFAAKKALYPAPAMTRTWEETPKATAYDPKIKTYPHVLEFWGGDLPSLRGRLDYITKLGADVVYLQPIFKAPSNHKYDTEDYFAVDPQYGSMADLKGLMKDVHSSKMRLMLDGVFNHVGVTSPGFVAARKNPKDPNRDWYFFGKEYAEGYRGWAGVASLPAWNLENPEVRDYLWGSKNSVVQKYLRDGIDGWRLDVAFELGHEYLRDLTAAAHRARKGSAVIGEISGYPADWFPAVDGVFNFSAINIGVEMVSGRISGGRAGRTYDRMVQDAGLENLLKSWLVAENHDTPRIASIVPDLASRKIVTALQLTLPGSPCIYYGQELGMTGTGDPESRAPMRWDLATAENPNLAWMRKLLDVRKRYPALKVGQFTGLETDRLLAFARTTGKVKESVIVVINPTNETVQETFTTRIGKLLSWGELEDTLTGKRIRSITGLLNLTMPPKSTMILVPVADRSSGYSVYDRID